MTKTIKLATYINPPYQFLDDDDNLLGMDYEIIKKSFEIAEYEMDLLICKNENIMEKMVENEEIDGAFQIRETPERTMKFIFSDLFRQSVLVFVTGSLNIDISTFEEIAAKKLVIGIREESSLKVCFESIPEKSKIYYDDLGTMLKDINDGNLDMAVVEKKVKDNIVKRLELESVSEIDGLRLVRSYCVMFNKKKSRIRDDFNLGLKKLIETNQYFEITKYWDSR